MFYSAFSAVGAQLSLSAPARYALGDTPITLRKALANLLALS